MRMSAFEENMLFVLHSILSVTEITNRRNIVIPSGLIYFQGMNTKAKSGHAADNVLWQIQVKVFGQNVRGIRDVGRLRWKSRPVVV
jgi:hypothetical protein